MRFRSSQALRRPPFASASMLDAPAKLARQHQIAPQSVSRSWLGGNRQAEPARLSDLKRTDSPRGLVRLRIQGYPRFLGVSGQLIDVLCRTDVDAHAHTFLAVVALLPVVLTETNLDVSRS